MAKSQSKKAGRATNASQIYEAQVGLHCMRCGGAILPGEHFTRPSLGGRPVRTGPVCRECKPFQEMPAGVA